MSENHSSLIYTARLAEQAERYEDMLESMKKIAIEAEEMNGDERNWFSMAYKHVVGSRRASWRVVNTVEQKEESKSNIVNVGLARALRQKIEAELTKICEDILSVLKDHLIPKATDAESKVFYNKMAADYYRYMAEYAQAADRVRTAEASMSYYKQASLVSDVELAPTHPIRLGLALNFSVFYFEILGQPQEACKLAREAFDLAVTRLDSVPEESYKETTLIMHLIRDNLNIWMPEIQANESAAAQPESSADKPAIEEAQPVES